MEKLPVFACPLTQHVRHTRVRTYRDVAVLLIQARDPWKSEGGVGHFNDGVVLIQLEPVPESSLAEIKFPRAGLLVAKIFYRESLPCLEGRPDILSLCEG